MYRGITTELCSAWFIEQQSTRNLKLWEGEGELRETLQLIYKGDPSYCMITRAKPNDSLTVRLISSWKRSFAKKLIFVVFWCAFHFACYTFISLYRSTRNTSPIFNYCRNLRGTEELEREEAEIAPPFARSGRRDRLMDYHVARSNILSPPCLKHRLTAVRSSPVAPETV